MTLKLQDPYFDASFLLHETMLNEFEKAHSGAAAFAFASKEGASLLLDDASFAEFMMNGTFHLIVGLDAITNQAALDELKRYESLFDGRLTIQAFVHSTPNSTFHPKFSWFDYSDGGSLVVGSGNLTQGGLRNNREAYAVISLTDDELAEIKQTWSDWLKANEGNLYDLDSAVVSALAKENERFKRVQHKVKIPKPQQEVYRVVPIGDAVQADDYDSELDLSLEDESTTFWLIDYESDVLIAEIPRSGDRWKQANFDKESFEHYFGATCGENGSYRILLKNVREDATLGETEVRQSVSVQSRNYRFELDAASGLAYPDEGRPIALFAKTATRAFLYELFMPGDEYYEMVIDALNARVPQGRGMRRVKYNAGELYYSTSELPIWKHEL